MKQKIRYKDLSSWLKAVVIYGFVSSIITILSFIYGIIIGLGI